jgi:hypothetical protein
VTAAAPPVIWTADRLRKAATTIRDTQGRNLRVNAQLADLLDGLADRQANVDHLDVSSDLAGPVQLGPCRNPNLRALVEAIEGGP